MEPTKQSSAKRFQGALSVVIVALVVIAFGCSLSGCSGGGGGGQAVSATTPNPTPTPAPIAANSEGVREDVKEKILARHPNEVEKQKASFQFAKAVQNAILAGNSSDPQDVFRVREESDRAVDCLIEKFPGTSFEELGLIEAWVANDTARWAAYNKFNLALSGGAYEAQDIENPCQ